MRMAKAHKVVIIFAAILLMSFLAVLQEPNIQASPSSDNWSMFLHDSAHTGVTTSEGPTKPVVVELCRREFLPVSLLTLLQPLSTG